MSGKSDDAYRTISEVAADLDLPQHVLRFWESRFPQIRPLKRGGGRRFYRPGDVALLRDIRRLLHAEGYTIKGVQRLLRERGGAERLGTARDGAGVEATADPADVAADEPPALDEQPPREAAADGGGEVPLATAAIDLAVLREALALVEACERRLGAAISEAALADVVLSGNAPPDP